MAGQEVGSAFYDLDLHADKFKKGVKDAKGEMGGLSGAFDNATNASKGLLLGVTAVGAAAVAAAGLSIKAFSESQDVQAQLQAVLKSTGGAAGVTAEQANNLANSLQKTTRFSDEAVLGAENLLLTFTSIGKDVFPDATKTVLDMSQALGQDTKSSAIQLGKALNDPIRGVTALRKVGVQFTDAQEKQIESLVKAGDLMGAQKIILAELSKEFGGSAEAAGKTFAGSLDRARNAFGDLMEKVGEALVSKIQPLIDGFIKWFDSVGGVDGVMKILGNTIQKIAPWIPVIASAILFGLVPALFSMAAGIWAAVAPLLPFIAIGAIVGLIIKALLDHFGGLGGLLAALQPVFQAVAFVWNDLIKPALMQVWTEIQTNLLPALKALWDQIAPVLIPVLKFLAIVIGVIIVAAILIIIGIIRLLVAIITWWADQTREQIEKIKTFINNVKDGFNALLAFLRSIADSVYHAIVDPYVNAFNMIKKGVEGAKEALKKLDPFKKSSPSLVDLVTRGTKAVADRYGSMFDSIASMATPGGAPFAPSLAGATSPVTNNNPVSTNINGNIIIGSNADADQFLTRLTRNQELAQRGLTTERK